MAGYQKITLLILMGFFAISPSLTLGRETERSRKEKPSRNNDREELIEERKSMAEEYSQLANNYFEKIIQTVNSFSEINEDQLKMMKREIVQSRQYQRYMDPEEQAVISLVDAWTGYYSKNLKRAASSAAKAYSIDIVNGDAYASQVMLSYLAGINPRPEIAIRPRRARRNIKNDENEEKQEQPTTMSEPKIDFFLPKNADKFFGRRYAELADMTRDLDSKIDYIGVLFWRLPEVNENEESNDLKNMPVESAAEIQEKKIQAIKAKTEIVSQELNALARIKEANKSKDKVFFYAINTNSEQNFVKAKDFISENKLEDLVANQNSLENEYSDFYDKLLASEFEIILNSEEPILLIVNRERVIEYSGSARGVLPKMMLEKLVPGSLEIKAAESFKNSINEFGNGPEERVYDSNSVSGGSSKLEKKNDEPEKNYRNLTTEEELEAQKLIQRAKMYRGSHTKLGSSKRAIEACREVITKFKDTKYEEEAKEILRSIPEHQLERYGVSKEELQ